MCNCKSELVLNVIKEKMLKHITDIEYSEGAYFQSVYYKIRELEDTPLEELEEMVLKNV